MRVILAYILLILVPVDVCAVAMKRPGDIVDDASLPMSMRYDRHIIYAAGLAGVPPSVVKAIMKTESEFNRTAVSPKGAQGLMQLMPALQSDYDVRDPFDSWENIYAGAMYIADLYRRFGDMNKALAAYNYGPNRVATRRILPRTVAKYVDNINSGISTYAGMDTRYIVSIRPLYIQ